MLGKLTWSAIPFDQPIPLVTSIVVIAAVFSVVALVVLKGWAPYVWREWITSVDHKRVGVMYCLLAAIMLLRGFSRASSRAAPGRSAVPSCRPSSRWWDASACT